MPVAIVTGASRGLGLAIATGLAKSGWQLVIDARNVEDLAAAKASIGGAVTAIAGSITDTQHQKALLAAAESHGGVDLLVNNAGILGPSPQPRLADYPLDILREVYDVNLFAPVEFIQHVLPTIREHRGAIVNITSDAAIAGYPNWGGYGSAKAAIEQASRILAEEEPEIRVWWVDPGDLRTVMHQLAFPGEDISDRPLPETVVPAFLRLLNTRPASGRIRLEELD